MKSLVLFLFALTFLRADSLDMARDDYQSCFDKAEKLLKQIEQFHSTKNLSHSKKMGVIFSFSSQMDLLTWKWQILLNVMRTLEEAAEQSFLMDMLPQKTLQKVKDRLEKTRRTLDRRSPEDLKKKLKDILNDDSKTPTSRRKLAFFYPQNKLT